MKSPRKMRQTPEQQKRDASARLQRRVQQQFPTHKVVASETLGGAKMSEVLKEFIAPYRDTASTDEAFRKLVLTAIIAWNAALLPAKERKPQLEKLVEAFPVEVRVEARAAISSMMERKEKHFSEYKRMILDFEVMDTGRDYHLVVVSAADEMPER